MSRYQFYLMDSSGRIGRPAEELKCLNDETAIAKAFDLLDQRAVEVWDGARFVVRLEPRKDLDALH